MQKRTGYDAGDVAEQVKALIVTLGGEGSVIYADGREYKIPGGQGRQPRRSHRLRRCLSCRFVIRAVK